MKAKELTKLSIDELKKELAETDRELFNIRLQLRTGQATRPHLVQGARKKIARIKTILGEKLKHA